MKPKKKKRIVFVQCASMFLLARNQTGAHSIKVALETVDYIYYENKDRATGLCCNIESNFASHPYNHDIMPDTSANG